MAKALPIPTVSSRIKPKKIQVNAIKELTTDKAKTKIDSWIVRCFNDFARNTALHGYNHIVREDTSKWEK